MDAAWQQAAFFLRSQRTPRQVRASHARRGEIQWKPRAKRQNAGLVEAGWASIDLPCGGVDFFNAGTGGSFCYQIEVRNIPPNLYAIRGLMGCCLLLYDGGNSVLIDTWLFGEHFRLRRLFRRLGLAPEALKAVLLTHGHIDHAGNMAAIKEWSGAKLYGHANEQAHIDGRYPYQGANRWCGRLESLARHVFAYRPAKIDEFIVDGQQLPFWDGLEVILLPGHTLGHCGFYSARHNLLFCGDMMASYFFNVHKPAAILNSAPELLPAAAERIRRLRPRWIVPLHFDVLNGDLHRRRFVKLYGMEDWVKSGGKRPVE